MIRTVPAMLAPPALLVLLALLASCGAPEPRASSPPFEASVSADETGTDRQSTDAAGAAGSAEAASACLPADERGPAASPRASAGPLRVYAVCEPHASVAKGPYVVERRGSRPLDDEAWSRLQARSRVLFLADRAPDIEAFDVGPCCDEPGRDSSKCLHLFLSGKPEDVASYTREVLSLLELPANACVPLYLHTHIAAE